jgi:hypothetical protein
VRYIVVFRFVYVQSGQLNIVTGRHGYTAIIKL